MLISDELITLNEEISELETTVTLSGEFDILNAYLEIHPGAGGTESCDWASMLARMYQRFSEKEGLKWEIIDEQKGDEAGIKRTENRGSRADLCSAWSTGRTDAGARYQ